MPFILVYHHSYHHNWLKIPLTRPPKWAGDDISGSSDIANRADNVVSVKRMSESDAVKHGFDTGLRILKSRWTGSTDNIRFRYESKSHRIYAADGGTPTWKYGWERSRHQSFEELPEEPVPFD